MLRRKYDYPRKRKRIWNQSAERKRDHSVFFGAKAMSAGAALRRAATWLGVDAAMREEMRFAVTESVLSIC